MHSVTIMGCSLSFIWLYQKPCVAATLFNAWGKTASAFY